MKKIHELTLGVDFLPTGLTYKQDLQSYVKFKQYKKPSEKFAIKLIKGTEKYCIKVGEEYFTLEDYDPYIKFYKMIKGKFMMNKNHESVMPCEDNNLWYRFCEIGDGTGAPQTLLPSQRSVEKNSLVYEDNVDLFFEGECVQTYNEDLVESKSKYAFYMQSMTSFECAYPDKTFLGKSKMIIPSDDGMYIINGKRIDYVQKFAGDYYVGIKDISDLEMQKLGIEKLQFEEVGLAGYTPITYYEIPQSISKVRILNFTALIITLALIAFATYLFSH